MMTLGNTSGGRLISENGYIFDRILFRELLNSIAAAMLIL